MTRAELTAYVAEHENEYVQQYVKALYEEHDELTSQLDAIVRSGYSDDGREAMREAGRILLLVVVIVIAYIVGRSSH
jgi:formyltetrahydrofolate synthetase